MNTLENISTGTDIESIQRFEKYSSDKNSAFVKKVYTELEIEYCFSCKNPAQHLAARFCAKEAIYKALCGFGVKNINFNEIEIYHNEDKVPQVRFLNPKLECFQCKISLSHCKDKAIANVIMIKN